MRPCHSEGSMARPQPFSGPLARHTFHPAFVKGLTAACTGSRAAGRWVFVTSLRVEGHGSFLM